ncbi:MAG: septum formation protein Maf [Chloroflexi bacterium HGW-Chloroflexi-8]|nr:MAG: septum formation protein Maf [Chloroflexi bacterium HGW-Chloroflexi-8]
MKNEPWILASNSPRRKELLGLFNHPFVIMPADVEESLLPGENPSDYVSRLAQTKASVISSTNPEVILILAADTTVADGDEILGKPLDKSDARRMLRQLRGRIHQVYTGISICSPKNNIQKTLLCRTNVPMRDYSDQELESYLDSGDPMDKAGAYGIQNSQFHPVENFSGCFASVMGLPLCHFEYGLKMFDQHSETSIAGACQNHLQYECPVYDRILHGEQVG